MRSRLIAAILVLFPVGFNPLYSIADAQVRRSQPNIVLIYADDLGWRDVG